MRRVGLGCVSITGPLSIIKGDAPCLSRGSQVGQGIVNVHLSVATHGVIVGDGLGHHVHRNKSPVGVGDIDWHQDEVFIKQCYGPVHVSYFVVVEGGPVGGVSVGTALGLSTWC